MAIVLLLVAIRICSRSFSFSSAAASSCWRSYSALGGCQIFCPGLRPADVADGVEGARLSSGTGVRFETWPWATALARSPALDDSRRRVDVVGDEDKGTAEPVRNDSRDAFGANVAGELGGDASGRGFQMRGFSVVVTGESVPVRQSSCPGSVGRVLGPRSPSDPRSRSEPLPQLPGAPYDELPPVG